MTDSEGNRFYCNAGKTERAVNEWTVTGGPYDSAEEAAAGCVTSTNTAAAITMSRSAALVGGFSPAQNQVVIWTMPMTIRKSTNGVTWFVADRIEDDPEHFEWRDTNAMSLHPQAFYRITIP
jgi:hypothetical protein